MKKLIVLISFMIGASYATNAQSITPKWTYNVELTLPVAMGNVPYDDIMQGLINGSMYGQYSFPFHFNVGLGAKYTYLTINEFSVPEPRFGGVHSAYGFLKLGYDKFHNDRFATDYGLKLGYGNNYFYSYLESSTDRLNVEVPSSIVEGTVAFILSADERNSYRWVIGYGFQGYNFQLSHIGIAGNEGYTESEINRPTNYLIVGFGYTYYFKSGNGN